MSNSIKIMTVLVIVNNILFFRIYSFIFQTFNTCISIDYLTRYQKLDYLYLKYIFKTKVLMKNNEIFNNIKSIIRHNLKSILNHRLE